MRVLTLSGSGPGTSSPASLAAERICGQAAGEGTLEVWMIRPFDVDPDELDGSLLSAEEQRRAGALIRAEDRVAFVASHVLLRQLLSGRLGCGPSEVSYTRLPCPVCGGPNGRPALDGQASSLHFSISRSSELALVAIASVPVGLDVQALAEAEVADEVAGLLHPAERREIESATRAERGEVFTRIWVRKEAYLKGIGTGIAHDLAPRYLGTNALPDTTPAWTLVDLQLPPGYVAAAAIASWSGANGA